jgi:hypothetical protein
MFIDMDTRARTREISNECDDPKRVEDAMVEAIKSKIRYTKKCVTLDKLRVLTKMRVGTSLIEQTAKQVEGGGGERRRETVLFILQRQTSNVLKSMKKLKQVSFQKVKEMLKMIKTEWRKDEARQVMRVTAEREWMRGKERMRKSVEFLKNKFGREKSDDNMIIRESVEEMTATGDDDLQPQPHTPPINPPHPTPPPPCDSRETARSGSASHIGHNTDDGIRVRISEDLSPSEMIELRKDEKAVVEGLEIDEDERAYLNVPKSLADHGEFDIMKTMTDINIMGDKMRWSLREKEARRNDDGSPQTLSKEEEEEERVKTAKMTRIINKEEKTVSFAKMRVTSMKSCTRITLPQPLEGNTEAKIDTLIGGLTDAARREAKRAKLKAKKASVYTESEIRGRDQIKKREKNKEGVMTSTDKSGKRGFLSTEKYREKVAKHTNKDVIVTVAEVDDIERNMSALAQSVARSLKVGMNWGHKERVKSACVTKFSKIPSLDIMLKDHKGGDDLPTRPVCRSASSPNGVLGDLVSDFLKILADEKAAETGTEVRSTEEMCAALEEVNAKVREERVRRGGDADTPNNNETDIEIVIGSMDVSALYPSLDIDRAAVVIEKMIMESKLAVDVDVDEMSTYIVSTHKQEEIDRKGLGDVCHTRRYHTNVRPGITGKAMTGNDKEKEDCQSWIPPVRAPNVSEKKKMLAVVIGHATKFVMNNHVYTNDDIIRKQVGGGAIGLRLTGEIARIIMIEFDSLLRAKLTSLQIHEWMYGRYVDDANCVASVLPLGTRYNKETDNLEIEIDAIESDRLLKPDLRTFTIIQEVANSIWPEIQWTMDVPSNHDDGMMPMLDTQVCVRNNQVMFEFYEKAVNTPYCIPERSAHSWKIKRSSLIQEGVRRMLNTSRNSSARTRRDVMESWDRKLRYSGYKYRFREQIISAALGIYKDKIEEDAKDGGRPLYRTKDWMREERDEEKELKSTNWYKGQGEVPNLAPLIVDPTEGGVMRKEMSRICELFRETHKIGVLVQERGGVRSSMDVRSDPLGTRLCKRDNCPICRTEGSKGGCQGGNVGYQHQCKLCDDIKDDSGKGTLALYIGETSKSGYERGLQHAAGLLKKKDDNVMHKHMMIHHQGLEPNFVMTVTGRFKGCLPRQEDEGTRLRESKAKILLNSKMQWHQPAISRVIVVRGNSNDDQIGAPQPDQDAQGARGTGRGRRGRGRGGARGRGTQ